MLKISSHHVKHTQLAEIISNICCNLFDEKQECYRKDYIDYAYKLGLKKRWNDTNLQALRLKNVYPNK